MSCSKITALPLSTFNIIQDVPPKRAHSQSQSKGRRALLDGTKKLFLKSDFRAGQGVPHGCTLSMSSIYGSGLSLLCTYMVCIYNHCGICPNQQLVQFGSSLRHQSHTWHCSFRHHSTYHPTRLHFCFRKLPGICIPVHSNECCLKDVKIILQ